MFNTYKVGDILKVKDLNNLEEWYFRNWSSQDIPDYNTFDKIIISEIFSHDNCCMKGCTEKFEYYFKTLDGEEYGMFEYELSKLYKPICD